MILIFLMLIATGLFFAQSSHTSTFALVKEIFCFPSFTSFTTSHLINNPVSPLFLYATLFFLPAKQLLAASLLSRKIC